MQSEWPSSKMVKTLPSNAGGGGLIPNPGAKIPPAWRSKHQNRNIIVTNSVKTSKAVHIKKIFKKIVYKQYLLERVGRKGNASTLFVGL